MTSLNLKKKKKSKNSEFLKCLISENTYSHVKLLELHYKNVSFKLDDELLFQRTESKESLIILILIYKSFCLIYAFGGKH